MAANDGLDVDSVNISELTTTITRRLLVVQCATVDLERATSGPRLRLELRHLLCSRIKLRLRQTERVNQRATSYVKAVIVDFIVSRIEGQRIQSNLDELRPT